MSQTPCTRLQVRDFFSTFNWSGVAPKLDPVESSQGIVEPTSWLRLSLEEFVQQANWMGKLSQKSIVKPLKLSVTLSVSEFFRGMVWEGSLEMAPIPRRSSSPKPPSSPSQDLNVNTLSDLF